MCLARRCLHTFTRHRLPELLRETAQSVAVVTALLPSSSSSPTYHGATLSSFTSIALDPLPLVAFSLRVPSRMASALNAYLLASPSSPSSPSPPPAHLVINILSAAQPHLADRFARPDLHPRPFADPDVRWTPSQEGLPILDGALGALACCLVCPSLPLSRLGGPHVRASDDALPLVPEGERKEARGGENSKEVLHASAGTGLASELFIARVLRVERVPLVEDGEHEAGLYKLPLLYHRRRYTTVEGHVKS